MTVYASYGEYYLRRTEFTLVVGQPLHLYKHPPQYIKDKGCPNKKGIK